MKKKICILVFLVMSAALRADYMIIIDSVNPTNTLRLLFAATEDVTYKVVNGNDPVMFIHLTSYYHPPSGENYYVLTPQPFVEGLSWTIDEFGITITGCPAGDQYKIATTQPPGTYWRGGWDPATAFGYVAYYGQFWYEDPDDPELSGFYERRVGVNVWVE